MQTRTQIREATTADLDAIGVLWQEFMDFHRHRDPHFARSDDGHERSRSSSVATSLQIPCVFLYRIKSGVPITHWKVSANRRRYAETFSVTAGQQKGRYT